MQNKKQGFTLVEIILYIAIVAVITTLVTNFTLDVLKDKSKQESHESVEKDASFVMNKIQKTIEGAKGIDVVNSKFGTGVTAGVLILQDANLDIITITQSGSSVYYQVNTDAPQLISSANTKIEKLYFLAKQETGSPIPKSIQIKLETASSLEKDGVADYQSSFQTTVVPKNADYDSDGCLDIVDQYPHDPDCCKDTDGDTVCDALDNCVLKVNTDQKDEDGDGIGFRCDDDDTAPAGGGGGGGGGGGTSYPPSGTIDTCIQVCSEMAGVGQLLCSWFGCDYDGAGEMETSVNNEHYAYNGISYTTDEAEMYWKKTFILSAIPEENIHKIDLLTFTMNYCYARAWLGIIPYECGKDATWLEAWAFGDSSMKGDFVGTQELELYNYTTSSWDAIGQLTEDKNSNDEIDLVVTYSNQLEHYINANKEIMARMEFRTTGNGNGSRFLEIDLFDLEVHVTDIATCGDSVKEADEQCDDGSHCEDGVECTGTGASACTGRGLADETCRPRSGFGNLCSALCLNENAVCGNSYTEVGEECDDGNTNSNDGCNAICEIERCGNAVKEGVEECDYGKRCDNDGNYCTSDVECLGVGDGLCRMRSGDLDQNILAGRLYNCSAICEIEECGNQRLDINEECDDGKNCGDLGATACSVNADCFGIGDNFCKPRAGDGCSEICFWEQCGNGIPDLAIGEECDDGNGIDDDDCNNSCYNQWCGDGLKNRAVEECDNGKQCSDGIDCTDDATLCVGRGLTDETCDTRIYDGCDKNCLIEHPVCGNGIQEYKEECDDNNINDGDGCSHTCMNEYYASYNFNNPTLNGLGKVRQAWAVLTDSLPLNTGTGADARIANAYLGSLPYQVEFDKVDELASQPITQSYYQISLVDSTNFVLPEANTGYVLHKFDFKIGENEFKTAEANPDRIEELKLNWTGETNSNGTGAWGVFIYPKTEMFVWNNTTLSWEKVAESTWSIFKSLNLTKRITSGIANYIDSDREVHFIISVQEQGNDYLKTDFAETVALAYGYKD